MAQIPAGSSGVLVTVSVAPYVIPSAATLQIQVSGPGGLTTSTATGTVGTSLLSYTSGATEFALSGRCEVRGVVSAAGTTLYGATDVVYVTAWP